MEFMIGTDPEVFLTDEDGNLRSAIDVIAGTKHEQQMVKGGGLQHDNVAAEFSCDPVSGEEDFLSALKNMLTHLSSAVKPFRINVRASANFPEAELQSVEARAFGCDPDYDCWELRVNEIDPSAPMSTFRSCGGHIHVGTKNGFPKILCGDDSPMGRVAVVKAMDLYVGIPSLIIDLDPTSPARRKLYGKAGAHRPKSYGVEYRSVGNFWLASPLLARIIYRLTSLAVNAADSDIAAKDIETIGQQRIISTINDASISDATEIYETIIKKYLRPETQAIIEHARTIAPKDPYVEWNLG